MMEHSPSAWQHNLFVQNIQKVHNQDLFYRAMVFYLEEEPMLLNDLLRLLSTRLDLTKTVNTMKKTGYIALVLPFLKSVQNQNIAGLNEALNEIHVENDDHESLRQSIKDYDNFESLHLAKRIENHELLEFRRLAAVIYRKNKKWKESIDISKKDELYKDAMETVEESRDATLAEDLLRYFMMRGDKEVFGSMLYTCYDLIKPDIALEIAWRFGLMEFAMPFFIQYVKDLSLKVDTVQKKTEDIVKKEEKNQEEQASQPLDMDVGFMFPGAGGFGGQPALPALPMAPGMMAGPPMGGMGGGMGMGMQPGMGGMGMGQQY
jgi:clathrin heavy chain